ncbi:MAG: GDSL-type esterase/lipase family protein [Bacillota bacterium]
MKKVLFAVLVISLVLVTFYIVWPTKDEESAILPKSGVKGDRNVVVFLGDSITAGYGLDRDLAFPSVIQKYWDENNISLRAVNSGVSGDTTGGVLYRLDSLLTNDVHMVFLEIGANDAFQKKDIGSIKENLIDIVRRIQEKDIEVALMAMEIPLNISAADREYAKRFANIYEEVGQECNVPVMGSLLAENEQNGELWLSDGIHPNDKGHLVIAKNVLKFLNPQWVY